MRTRAGLLGAATFALLVWIGGSPQLPAPSAAEAAESAIVAAQVLSYEEGFIFLTTGEAFRVVPNPQVVDAKGAPSKHGPELGSFVKLTFDALGNVTQIVVSDSPLKADAELASVERYAVMPRLTASTSASPVPGAALSSTALRNALVKVSFTVEVPTTTLSTDQVYMATSETQWDPLGTRLDRIDAQHFRAVLDVPAGSRFRYLFTRGNSLSIERGKNGLQRPARTLVLRDVTPQIVSDRVEHWGDEAGNSLLASPQTTPTPFNPAPYPNLPPPVVFPIATHH
jgi:hypothetical protein